MTTPDDLKEQIGDADLDTVRGYARALARMGDPTARVINERGEIHPYAPYDAERWGPKGRLKECFRNAWNLVQDHPDELTYVEGYATSLAVCHHAWVLDPDGHVQDATWRTPDDGPECGYCLGDGIDLDTDEDCWVCDGTGEAGLGSWEGVPEYFGIAIPLEEVAATILRTKTYGVLGKEWMLNDKEEDDGTE